MKTLGIESLFSEEQLARLPLNYQFMTKVAAHTFQENYAGRRFSASTRHQSKNHIGVVPGKPVSHLIIRELFTGHD